MEVPYYTHVRSTGRENDAGPPYGKWIDLLVVDQDLKNWQWIELKVIHAANNEPGLYALKPFVYDDTASLLGFSLDWTESGWRKPPNGMKLKKVIPFLESAVNRLPDAKHHFASVLLLLHSGEDHILDVHQSDILENIKGRIHARGWKNYEKPPASFQTSVEDAVISPCGISGKLITAKWTMTKNTL